MLSWPACFLGMTGVGFPAPGTPPLLAYLDPGVGSYAFQVLLASLFGGMFVLKQSWSEVKGWFLERTGARSARPDSPAKPRGVGAGVGPLHVTRPRIDAKSPAEIP